MGIHQLLIIYPVVILAAMSQGAISMGFALIAAPVLLLLHPAFVPAPVILSGLSLSLMIMIRDHKSIDFSGLTIALSGRLMGAIVAAFLISSLSRDLFAIIVGSIILLAVCVSLLHPAWTPTSSILFGAGVLSGLMGTLTSIGAPPMSLLYQHQQGAVIRGTLSGFLAAGGVISLFVLRLVGKFTLIEIRLFLWIFPALVIGFWLSGFMIKFLDKGYLRASILMISALSGLFLIIKTLINVL